MVYLAWSVTLVALALALWGTAAFLLRLRHTGRLVLTVFGPALVVGLWTWSDYLERRVPNAENWDSLFVILSVCVGGATAVAMIPIWFLAEEKLGWRAR